MIKKRRLVLPLVLAVSMLSASLALAGPAVVRTIATPSGEGYNLAFNPKTNLLYIGSGYIDVVDVTTNKVVDTIATDFDSRYFFGAMAINPVTNKLYATSDCGSCEAAVYVIDLKTKASKRIDVPKGAHDVAINTVTNKVYVTSYGGYNLGGYLDVIDGATDTLIKTIDVDPTFIDEQPDYLAVNEMTNQVFMTVVGPEKIYKVDGHTDSVIASAPLYVKGYPRGFRVALDQQTNRLYVINASSYSHLRVLSSATLAQLDLIPLAEPAGALAVRPETKRLYVSMDPPLSSANPGKLLTFDTANDQLVDSINLVPADDIVSVPDIFRLYLTVDGTLTVMTEEDTPPVSGGYGLAAGVVHPSDQLSGWATDGFSGVAKVMVTYAPAIGSSTPVPVTISCDPSTPSCSVGASVPSSSVRATVTCYDPSRLSCYWFADVPRAPGAYAVTIKATDRAGNTEWPGTNQVITVAP